MRSATGHRPLVPTASYISDHAVQQAAGHGRRGRGTPDRAAARLLEYMEAGADRINIALRAPGRQRGALEVGLNEVAACGAHHS